MNSLTRPFYAVLAEYQYKSINEVIVAYDSKPLEDKAINAIRHFTGLHKLGNVFRHTRMNEDNPLQNWNEIREQFGDNHLELVEKYAENIEEGIEIAMEGKAALLAMVRHKQSF